MLPVVVCTPSSSPRANPPWPGVLESRTKNSKPLQGRPGRGCDAHAPTEQHAWHVHRAGSQGRRLTRADNRGLRSFGKLGPGVSGGCDLLSPSLRQQRVAAPGTWALCLFCMCTRVCLDKCLFHCVLQLVFSYCLPDRTLYVLTLSAVFVCFTLCFSLLSSPHPHPYISLSTHLSIYQSIYLSINIIIYLTIYVSIYLSIYLSSI